MTVRLAVCFPGQGSQRSGMHDGVKNHELFHEFSKYALQKGVDLDAIMNGDALELTATQHAQPALFTVETVLGIALKESLPKDFDIVAVLGHSIGEYAACAVAGAVELADGLNLVIERGQAMSAMQEGSMVSVLGLTLEAITQTVNAYTNEAAHAGVIAIAGINAPEQIVLSGDSDALTACSELLGVAGAKRIIPLTVSGAFHSPLMHEAALHFAKNLADVTFSNTTIPIIQNIDGEPHSDAASIEQGLEGQIEAPVQWVHSVEKLQDLAVSACIELGPGTVLSGLIKRILPDMPTYAVGSTSILVDVLQGIEEDLHGSN